MESLREKSSESPWLDYQEYLIEKAWLEERERLFIRMSQAGIPPWEFHRHIKEFEANEENSPDRLG